MLAFDVEQRRRGLRPSSISARHYVVTRFLRWIAPRSADEATQDDVQAYLDSRRLAPRSRYTNISHLHAFYVWGMNAELLAHDPTARIVRPRLRQGLPRPIADADLMMAFEAADARMRSWLCLAAYEGLRCQEIAGIERQDVLDTQSPPLLIVSHGKGGQQRVLPLNAETELALRSYGMPRAGRLYLLDNGRPITPTRVSQLINRFLHGLGIDSTAHTLRHWFGTRVYADTGHDLLATQQFLGHASPVTTSVYARFSFGEAAHAVRGLSVGSRVQARSERPGRPEPERVLPEEVHRRLALTYSWTPGVRAGASPEEATSACEPGPSGSE